MNTVFAYEFVLPEDDTNVEKDTHGNIVVPNVELAQFINMLREYRRFSRRETKNVSRVIDTYNKYADGSTEHAQAQENLATLGMYQRMGIDSRAYQNVRLAAESISATPDNAWYILAESPDDIDGQIKSKKA